MPNAARDLAQRKHRILTHGTPSITDGIADAIVVKAQNLFFLTAPDGNVPVEKGHGLGLYHHDCRYLRGYELRIGGLRPTVLAASADAGNAAAFQLANPDLRSGGGLIAKETIGIRWERTLDGERPALRDVLTFRNYGLAPIEFPISLAFDAAFEDVFAVRGLWEEKLGHVRRPAWHARRLELAYAGKDLRDRALRIDFSRAPARHIRTTAHFIIALEARAGAELAVTLTVREHDRRGSRAHSALARRDERPKARRNADVPRVRTRVTSDSLLLDATIERSLGDLRMLQSRIDGEEFFAAGLPWFATLFGRDSIITALQMLAWEPEIAAQTARLLARYQGHEASAWHDEDPGKILHSLRVGEMARLGEIPHTPYYGSVDATPLFLILIGRHAAWTGNLALFEELHDAIEAALGWMAGPADLDGDGYIEYACASQGGLVNQGWKDSGDCIIDAKGRLATPPIALVEVQGYAWLARTLIADLYERAGDPLRSTHLRREAQALRERFDRDFWVESMGCYALGLEARKKPLAVVTSNPGHALWSGIAEPRKARRTAERLMADDMFNGWGIRTLSGTARSYNPVGYHLGTVWPHDNSLIAVGFRRYGFDDLAKRIFDGLMHAAMRFPGYRLPEVFAGFSRKEDSSPVHFPVACHPQAWAAGSIPYLLESLLGLAPHAFDRRLRVVRPMLPDLVDRLTLRDFGVAGARLSLAFERTADRGTAVTVLQNDGGLDVVIEPPDHPAP